MLAGSGRDSLMEEEIGLVDLRVGMMIAIAFDVICPTMNDMVFFSACVFVKSLCYDGKSFSDQWIEVDAKLRRHTMF